VTARRRRAGLAVCGCVFVATRLLMGWWADHPERYGSARFPVVTDITLYQSWAERIIVLGQAPYADVAIEYPPGVLPFVVAPQLGSSGAAGYRVRFIALLLLVDVSGLAGLWRIARRSGSDAGLWAWTILLPLLGPLVYARLDLIAATATIWAMERAAARRWLGAGLLLGYGGMVKVYPLLLLPLAFVMSSKRWQFAIGAALATLLPLAVLAGAWGPLVRQVVLYHTARGISLESTWGALLLVASKLGHDVRYEFAYGALLVQSTLSPLLKRLGTLLTLSAVGAGTVVARRASQDDGRFLAGLMFGTLATVVGVSNVFSPQFVTWLLALGAAALCFRDSPLRPLGVGRSRSSS
jgi:glycosyl transferase family 87